MDVKKEYRPVAVNDELENDLRCLVRLSIAEDLSDAMDWTTVCLIEPESTGCCQIVPRETGICAGLAVLPWIIDEFDAKLHCERSIEDGSPLVPGNPIATIRGSARDLLTAERTILNIISRMCGVATLTHEFTKKIENTKTRLYDTRKTTPGWRRLEKYAVRCGGGHNHRTGLFDGFLIKDNHLALAGDSSGPMPTNVAADKALRWRGASIESMLAPEIVEIEVDSLKQFSDCLQSKPDIILLDNFALEELEEAVAIRDEKASDIELEASGNVTIDTIGKIASTGVDRISSGALTHQATWLDLGMDWLDESLS